MTLGDDIGYLLVESMYHRLFNSLLTLRSVDDNVSIQLHGNDAGRALRSWALKLRIDVVPTIGELPDRTWSQLEARPPGGVFYLILVHLDDNIPTATAPPPAPEEIPF